MPTRNLPIRRAGVLAAAALAATPLAAAAAPRSDARPAQSGVTISLGTVFGGLTSQDWPVIVEVDLRRPKVNRIVAGVQMQCTSGVLRVPDRWNDLRVKRGKFGASFGPESQPNDDGTTTTLEGAVSGKFNRSRTRVSGTWSEKATFRDAAGVVTDTCDSGVVNWSAKD
jgi:hypothetical protein